MSRGGVAEQVTPNGSKLIVIEAMSGSRRAHARKDAESEIGSQKKVNPVDLSKTFEDINIDNSQTIQDEPEIVAAEQDAEESSDDDNSETFNFMESKLEMQKRKNKVGAPKSTKLDGKQPPQGAL